MRNEIPVESMLVAPAQAAAAIMDAYPAYVPLKRVIDEVGTKGKGSMLKAGQPVKHMKGSGRQVIDPLAAMHVASVQMHATAIKTLVARKLVDLSAKHEGLGWMATRIDAPQQRTKGRLGEIVEQLEKVGLKLGKLDREGQGSELTQDDLDEVFTLLRQQGFVKGGEPVACIYKNGDPQWWEFDKDLFQSICDMNMQTLPMWLEAGIKPLTMVSKSIRLGATALRASFGLVANPGRDIFHAAINTEGSAVMMPLRSMMYGVRQLAELVLGEKRVGVDPMAALFRRYGGELSTYIGQDIEKAWRHSREMLASAQGRRAVNIVRHPVEFLQHALGFMENAPRLAEFEAVLRKNGITREDLKKGRDVPMEVAVEAMLAASEVTIDFRRAGHVMRFMNRINAFSNVKIQGVSQVARKMGLGGDNHDRGEKLKRSMIRGSILLTLPTIAYWFAVKDEDWYQELPAWRKYFFWNFRAFGKTWSIPRPFEYGMIFSGLPEAMLDAWNKNNPKALAEFGKAVWQTQGPNLGDAVPDLPLIAIEVATGWDTWRDRRIVDENTERGYKPKDQYYEYNTAASQHLGELLNMSPAKIDHLISRATGNLGTDLLRIPEEGPVRALGFGRFNPSFAKGASVDEFYDRRKAAQQAAGSDKRNGEGDDAVSNEYHQTQRMDAAMEAVRGAIKENVGSDRETWRDHQKYLTGLARWANGEEPLSDYPNPLTSDDIPDYLRPVRDKLLGQWVWAATGPKDTESSQAADAVLDQLGIDQKQRMQILNAETKRRGGKPVGVYKNGKPTSYGERQRRLMKQAG